MTETLERSREPGVDRYASPLQDGRHVLRDHRRPSGAPRGLALIQRDERRHIAYGTYLCRRVISQHPETWSFADRRWAELTGPYLAMAGPQAKALADRRLEALAVARAQTPEEVDGTSADELEKTAESTRPCDAGDRSISKTPETPEEPP